MKFKLKIGLFKDFLIAIHNFLKIMNFFNFFHIIHFYIVNKTNDALFSHYLNLFFSALNDRFLIIGLKN